MSRVTGGQAPLTALTPLTAQGRALLVLGSTGATYLALSAWAGPAVLATATALTGTRGAGSEPGSPLLTLDTGLAAGAAIGAFAVWALLGRLLVLAGLSTVAALRHGWGSPEHLRRTGRAPAVVTQVVAALLGAGALQTGLAVGALAAPPAAPALSAPVARAGTSSDRASAGELSLDRPGRTATPGLGTSAVPVTDPLVGWTPDRPSAVRRWTARDHAVLRWVAPARRPGTSVREDVVVRRGDTLWDIAARHLGPGASPAAVSAEWPRWYAANRHVIGPDADLLHPGQRLRPPA